MSVAVSEPHVLLVHANPLQRVLPVPPYGLELVRSALDGVTGSCEIIDPFLTDARPLAAAAESARRSAADVIGVGLRVLEDCIPIDGLAEREEPLDVHSVIGEVRQLVAALREARPDATIVLGGAGFSACPAEALDELDVPLGVVGAGERPFRTLVERVAAGAEIGSIAGVVRRGEAIAPHSYVVSERSAAQREPLYAPAYGFPVRLRTGCAMACSYCTAANMGRVHGDGDVGEIVDEIAALVASARLRGLPVLPLFLAADEVNLPDERLLVRVLRELVARELAKSLRWRGYFNPTPFSDELCELIVATNGTVSMTVDSACDDVLARNGKPFRRRHLDAAVERVVGHGITLELGLIFGMPGETEQTLAETVAWVHALPARVEVVYAAGARVYPGTPLARAAEAEPEHVVRVGEGAARPRRLLRARDATGPRAPAAGAARSEAAHRSARRGLPQREPCALRGLPGGSGSRRSAGLGSDARGCDRGDSRNTRGPPADRALARAARPRGADARRDARGRRRRCRAAATRTAGVCGDGCDGPAGAARAAGVTQGRPGEGLGRRASGRGSWGLWASLLAAVSAVQKALSRGRLRGLSTA